MGEAELLFKEQRKVKLDIIALFWIVLAILIALYGTTYVDIEPSMASKNLISSQILIAGLFLTYITVGVVWSDIRYEKSFFPLVFAGLAGVMISNVASKFTASSVSVPPALFSVLIGISEETFFRGFVQSLAESLTNNTIFAIIISSAIFTTYHFAVYSGTPQALFVMFGAGLVLGTVFSLSRRLSINYTCHGIYNLLAMLR